MGQPFPFLGIALPSEFSFPAVNSLELRIATFVGNSTFPTGLPDRPLTGQCCHLVYSAAHIVTGRDGRPVSAPPKWRKILPLTNLRPIFSHCSFICISLHGFSVCVIFLFHCHGMNAVVSFIVQLPVQFNECLPRSCAEVEAGLEL